ncbi:hypothetical protein [Mammaliicoccus sciuri]|nr:hypothetical protein [Mammaliicoccus sciuri]
MYDDSAIAQTPYNESINGLNQTTLILRSWEYNPKNQLMEVTIETVHTGTDAAEPTFTFEAKGKESKETYPAKKVYESDNVMIIHIEHVPTEYRVIGLFVTEHRDDKILKQEYKRQLKNDSDVATTETDKVEMSDLPKAEDVIIVGDYREIEVNKNLVAKSDKEYQREAIVTDMERIKQEISTIIDENIPFQEELIAALTKEKTSLKNEMEFETKEEQSETEKEIEHKDNAISSAEEETEQYKSKVKELKKKYENREEKLDALLHPERHKDYGFYFTDVVSPVEIYDTKVAGINNINYVEDNSSYDNNDTVDYDNYNFLVTEVGDKTEKFKLDQPDDKSVKEK